ncbi:hypothetical protein [Mycolicibacter icosiumassiliensis]|uniref:hypothetical protein n=1 Tax=Mycolicibacter icosiumassiliensis TaxID=1792835 RepID=UPI00082BBE98|nr:hypothetical protein [Mycolicibacter icosiumassiliensis]
MTYGDDDEIGMLVRVDTDSAKRHWAHGGRLLIVTNDRNASTQPLLRRTGAGWDREDYPNWEGALSDLQDHRRESRDGAWFGVVVLYP